jgi:hypothetical protein
MKKRIIALTIMVIVILGPFQMAFRNIDNDHPMQTLFAFFSVLIGIGVSITLFEISKKELK